MMTTIPIGGKSGATFNRPFDAGEEGRTPAHSHAVTVTDPGHNHVNVVNDPGHEHSIKVCNTGHQLSFHDTGPLPPYPDDPYQDPPARQSGRETFNAPTGILVDSLPAKSSVSVSIDANEAGEHYPLVYVLVCQK